MDLRAWLFEDVDLDRLLDMDRRLAPARRNALAVLGLALLVCSPWLGPWTLPPLFLAAALFGLATRLAGDSKHPEYLILGAWIVTEVIIALAVALTGGPRVATMGWLAIPVVTLFRFTERLAKIGAIIALTLLAAVAFGTGAHSVLRDPPLLVAPAATIISVALLLVALIRSDIEHRGASLIDDLTGVWNRRAYYQHAEALEQRSQRTGDPGAVIMLDLDSFKLVNDLHGHPAGDKVLANVARRIRGERRVLELIYRYGGEEFVLLLPGAELEDATAFAETVRAAVAEQPVGDGHRMTVSLGVAASMRGQPIPYAELFKAADAAMYRAKEQGRNRVCSASHSESVTSRPAQQGALAGATL